MKIMFTELVKKTCFFAYLMPPYSVHKIRNKMNPGYLLIPFFFKMYFNTVLPSMHISHKWSLPYKFSD